MFKWLKEIFFGDIHKEPVVKKELSDQVTHWSNKSFAAPGAKTETKPFGKKIRKAKSHTKAQLSKMTKSDLEKLGRKAGVELDRRLLKSKLVDQLHKAL
jgi:hypothetical protein